MKKVITTKIEVKFWNLKVTDDMYYFDYKYYRNGKLKAYGEYSSDHSRRGDLGKFKQELNSHWAVDCVLQQEI